MRKFIVELSTNTSFHEELNLLESLFCKNNFPIKLTHFEIFKLLNNVMNKKPVNITLQKHKIYLKTSLYRFANFQDESRCVEIVESMFFPRRS